MIVTKTYDDEIFGLRRLPHKLEKKDKVSPFGIPVLDCYHPHFPMRASEWARTKKVYSLFRKVVKEHFGADIMTDGEVYRQFVLMLLEHCAREMKLKGDNISVVTKLMLPLPKAEWLVIQRKAEKTARKRK